VNTIEN
jgi:hypothetical protein